MELRDVLIILGIVLIAVIVWDGVRRMKLRKPKPRRPVTDLGPDPEEEKKKAELARELPNGGARVRDMTEEEREVISSRLNLRERVPMLMDSVDAEPEAERETPAPADGRVEQQTLTIWLRQESPMPPIRPLTKRTTWPQMTSLTSWKRLKKQKNPTRHSQNRNRIQPPTRKRQANRSETLNTRKTRARSRSW